MSDRPADAPVTLIEVVFPDQANHYGTLFGGTAMGLMDKAAFVVASRRARRGVVTVASERIEFHEAARVGDILEITARIESVGRTSVTVMVTVEAEDLRTGARRAITSGRFRMVAVDEDGRPTPVDRED